MKELSNRTATFTDSVIRRMTRISNKYGAVNLSQGFPDFDPPAQLLNSLSTIAADPKPLYHQYSITWGSQAMREALAAKQEHFMGIPINPNENIVVTCGSTEAMMAAMMTVTNPGDKVVIFSPFYENYGADTILSGAEPIYVPLNPPTFDFDREVLEASFRDNDPKAIVLCNPSNPCGKVFTREELTFIADLCKEYDAYCITDEVYEHIVYEGHKHTYMSTLPGMRERTVCCSSLSKTYSVTGWRLGYALAPQNIMDRIKQYHDFNTVGAPSPLMEAAVVGLDMPMSYYEEFGAHYAHMKALFTGGMKELGIPFTDPQGTYFVLADISPFLKKGQSDVDFCVEMAQKIGVGAVPGSSFFDEDVNHIIRLHFAKKDETLNTALERLSHLKDLAR